MAWIRMLVTHSRVWGPAGPHDRRITTRYREDARYRVKKAIADELVDKAVAVRIRAPRRGELALEQRFNGADPAAFDHDHDGRPGGSERRSRPKGDPA